MVVRTFGIKRSRLPVESHGRVRLTECQPRMTEIDKRRCVARCDRDRRLKAFGRFRVAAAPVKRHTKVIECFGIARRLGDGVAIAGDGLVQLPRLRERHTEVVQRNRIARADGERPPIGDDGVLEAPRIA